MAVGIEVVESDDFVVHMRDQSQMPVDQLVGAGLRRADEAGMTTVTVPLVPNVCSSEDPVMALLRGILIFKSLGPKSVQCIRVVIHRNPAAVKYLKTELERAAEAEKQNWPGYIAK
ncbi:MAG: hypothetical protein NVSMB39_4560 [Candidatus Saccharimonadales bacterium]